MVPPPRQLKELSRPDKSKAIARALFRSIIGVTGLLLAYGFLPLSAATNDELVLRIIVAGVIIVLVLMWEVSLISRAEFPALSAAAALVNGITLLVVVFASTYLSLSRADVTSYSEPLGRTGAMYFTMTTLSTVGYGDIVAKSDAARIAVMMQMIFNVAFIGLAVKWIAFTAKRRLGQPEPQ